MHFDLFFQRFSLFSFHFCIMGNSWFVHKGFLGEMFGCKRRLIDCKSLRSQCRRKWNVSFSLQSNRSKRKEMKTGESLTKWLLNVNWKASYDFLITKIYWLKEKVFFSHNWFHSKIFLYCFAYKNCWIFLQKHIETVSSMISSHFISVWFVFFKSRKWRFVSS